MNSFIVADVLNRSADDGSCAGGVRCSGNYIDVGSSENDMERHRERKLDGEHLAFAWRDVEVGG